MQVEVVVLEGLPQPFDEEVVLTATAAVHADGDPTVWTRSSMVNTKSITPQAVDLGTCARKLPVKDYPIHFEAAGD
jgi:hypothetical protein